MSPARVVAHVDAPWLPVGGCAEVWLARTGDAVPGPVALVRLLVTEGERVLAVPRRDGIGLDIPTVPSAGADVEKVLAGLVRETVGALRRVRMLGYVRNVVHDPPAGYPWPSPYAHFAVWHCRVEVGHDVRRGTWLEPAAAGFALGERHWWPLASYAR